MTGRMSCLKRKLKILLMLSKDNVLYLMLDGTICAVDLIAKDSKVIASGLTEESYKVSENNKMIAWQSDTDKTKNKKLILLNLNTTEESRTTVPDSQRIAPIGFMGDDIIYGIADSKDILTDKAGETIFPMNQIIIQNEQGEVLKQYKQDGIFVTEGLVEDNLLTLKPLPLAFLRQADPPVRCAQRSASTVAQPKSARYHIGYVGLGQPPTSCAVARCECRVSARARRGSANSPSSPIQRCG